MLRMLQCKRFIFITLFFDCYCTEGHILDSHQLLFLHSLIPKVIKSLTVYFNMRNSSVIRPIKLRLMEVDPEFFVFFSILENMRVTNETNKGNTIARSIG